MNFHTKTSTLLGTCLLSTLALGCGDDSPVGPCGEGTVIQDGECVVDPNGNNNGPDETPPTTSASVEGGRFFEIPFVSLITNEPATIYYTTDGTDPTTSSPSGQILVLLPELEDGTELKYFAVDTAGNAEGIQSQSYVLDLVGPGPATALSLQEETDGSVTLTWTNPTDDDFAGVVLMREGKSQSLIQGEAADAAEVVFVGDGTTATDDPGEGYFNYTLVSFDDRLTYGGSAFVAYDNPSVVTGSTGWTFRSDGTFTAGAAAVGVAIAVTFDAGTTFDVSLTNNTAIETFHAPKALFTNIVDGTWGDGTVDGETFSRVGDNGVSLAPGETLTGSFTVTFTGADIGGGVFEATADLAMRSDAIFLSASERNSSDVLMIVDEGTFTDIGGMDADDHIPTGNDSGYNGMKGVASRKGSRFVWAGNRSQGSVRKIDTATWTTIAAADIGTERNLVTTPTFGTDGLLWVNLSMGGPGYIGTSSSAQGFGNFLVAINPDSMTEVRRIHVSDGGRLRSMVAIPGTSKFVVTYHTGGVLYVVDTSLSGEAAVNAIESADITPSRSVTLSADGNTAYLAGQSDSYHNGDEGDVSIVDLVGGTVTAIPDALNGFVQASGLDPATGNVWFGSQNNISIMDPSDSNSVVEVIAFDAEQMLVSGGLIYAADSSTLREIDPDDQSILRTTGLPSSVTGHTLVLVE